VNTVKAIFYNSVRHTKLITVDCRREKYFWHYTSTCIWDEILWHFSSLNTLTLDYNAEITSFQYNPQVHTGYEFILACDLLHID